MGERVSTGIQNDCDDACTGRVILRLAPSNFLALLKRGSVMIAIVKDSS